jgi:hypothetical protein
VKAIREIDPEARMVHIDPLILVVPPRNRPDLADAADRETHEDTFYAWDVIAGRRHPELGGSPEVLDIVGVNCYAFGQMEYREHGPHASLELHDERIRPLGDLLSWAWERYRRPMIVGKPVAWAKVGPTGCAMSSRRPWRPSGRASTFMGSACSPPWTCRTDTRASGSTTESAIWRRRAGA